MTVSFVHKRGLISRHDVQDAYIIQTIHVYETMYNRYMNRIRLLRIFKVVEFVALRVKYDNRDHNIII